ncbi:MAG TPA: hypothetical protein VMV77_08965 [Bacteroidales bacterium]|nr:hypothetical protein [Bacteroidales bacterium]
MNGQFFKNLLMALMAVVVTAFSTTPLDTALLIISLISATLIYVGKNAFLPALTSITASGTWNWKNVFSGLLIAIGNGILNGAAMIILNGVIDVKKLLLLTLSIALTYFGATVFNGPTKVTKIRQAG